MNITKRQFDAIRELHSRGGAVLTSEWVNGSGAHTTRRVVPPYCERIVRGIADCYPRRIRLMFERHPRALAVVAIVNMRAVNKLLNPPTTSQA